MANDKKELDIEMLNKIAGGESGEFVPITDADRHTISARSDEYAREMAVKYGLDFDQVDYADIMVRMTREERRELMRRMN